jgi:hypothetical protein
MPRVLSSQSIRELISLRKTILGWQLDKLKETWGSERKVLHSLVVVVLEKEDTIMIYIFCHTLYLIKLCHILLLLLNTHGTLVMSVQASGA